MAMLAVQEYGVFIWKKMVLNAGLQITVGHRTLADQNLLMSDEIPNVAGHDVRTNFFIANHFTATMNKNLP